MRYDQIVKRQQEADIVYGYVNGSSYSYKLELVKERKPDLLVLGSSRVMQMRQEFFTAPFANAGGGMGDLQEGYQFLDELLKVHKPVIILLGVDYWWFNDDGFEIPTTYPAHEIKSEKFRLDWLKDLFKGLYMGRMSLSSLGRVLFAGELSNNVTTSNNLGLRATVDSTGVRPDGSYQWDSYYFSLGKYGSNFQQYLDQLDHGTNTFVRGGHIGQRLGDLLKIVELAHESGIKVVVYTPPLAPPVLDKMTSMKANYGYIVEMQAALRSLPVEYYDFLSGDPYLGDPCEYLDGYHPGDVIDQRILLSITNSNRNSALAPYINTDLLERSVIDFKGKTLTVFDAGKYNKREGDFLGLGCVK